MEYFSDKEKGSVSRTNNDVSMIVWTGLVSYINVLVNKGYFGKDFPEECPDGRGCIGTNEDTFKAALQSEIPNLGWPLGVDPEDEGRYGYRSRTKNTFIPDYLDVMDLLQFCYKHVALPIEGNDYHSYYGHTHIDEFDVDAGRNEFHERVNVIFARNGMAYELQKTGDIIRLLSPELVKMMSIVNVPAEVELKLILARANSKIVNFDVQVRYDAVKELWDFWERLKSVYNPSNKKRSVTQLLDNATNTPEFRNILEDEAKYLTDIGNQYFIRHAEMNQVKIQESDHIEYLYHRMFSLIHLLMKNFNN